MNHNLAKRHPKGAFSFLENAHSVRFSCVLRTLKGNKKGWRTGKWFSSQVPWRTTIPGHNHYVQYNRQMEKSQLRHWENWDAGTARIQDRSTIRKHRKSNTRHRPYPRGTTDACTGSH